MNKSTWILVFILLTGFSGSLSAQFIVSGEFRPRFEYRDGYSRLPDSSTTPATFISQRLRLTAQYRNEHLGFRFTMQEIRVWGDTRLRPKNPTLTVYEAVLDWRIADSLVLALGRQELVYGNERFFGAVRWAQTGQTHDAAVLRFRHNGWRADLGAAFNQSQEHVFGTDYDNSLAAISGNYKTLNYLWIEKPLKDFRFTVFGIADGFQKPGTRETLNLRGTLGGVLALKRPSFSAVMRWVRQTGHTPSGQEINAWYMNPELTLKAGGKLSLTPGMEYFTGNDATSGNDSRTHCFHALYGNGHKFNGHMDYFTNFPLHTKGAGLVNPYFKIAYTLNTTVSFNLDIHYFAMQNNYLDPSGKTLDKGLGTELDLNCSIRFPGEINLLFGPSLMFARPSMKYMAGGDPDKVGKWAFVQLTFKPVLFNSAKQVR